MEAMILLGALAAFGLVCALWTAAALFSGRRHWGEAVCICRPGLRELGTVRRLCRLQELGMLGCRVVLVDCGLTQQERMLLRRTGRNAVICSPDQLLTGWEIGAESIDRTGIGDLTGHSECCGISEL